MTNLPARAMVFLALVFGATLSASTFARAHTANISSSRIVPEAPAQYRVEVGFLGSDIERMFAEHKSDLSPDIDLTAPGVIEAMIGRFIQKRVALQNAEGQSCASEVVSVGEDMANPSDSKAVLRMDCRGVAGQIFYNPYKLLEAQGARAKHFVSIGEKGDESGLTEAQRMGREPAPVR